MSKFPFGETRNQSELKPGTHGLRFLAPLILFAVTAAAQPIALPYPRNCTLLKDEIYGDRDKNTFDIILPTSDKPTGLVIYIHGGGFVQGDKSEVFQSRSEDIGYFLKHKMAFASLNYRYQKTDDSVGVAASLKDVRTALQYIRHHAAKYNINKELIACYGSSAGAGSSLYLAFHDDLAVTNDTTLLGESTRIRCAGALATQATYDVFRWFEFIPGLDSIQGKAKDRLYDSAAHFYGYPSYPAFEPHRPNITRELDMLQMISPDDPPVYIMNLQKETVPRDLDAIEHHPAHAQILSEYLSRHGVKHDVYIYSQEMRSEKDVPLPVREFLLRHLQ